MFALGLMLSLLAAVPAGFAAAPPGNLAELKAAFAHPPDDARIMMRWWWFGPSVTKPEIEREMRLMKEGGIGGFEVQPTYPLALDDPEHGFRNFPYLSDEFLDVLRFTGEKARELGLRFDLTLGSGWPFGGPHIPITQAAGRLRVNRVPAPGGASSVPLPNLRDGEKFIAAFLAKGDRTQRLGGIENGAVKLPPDAGDGQTVLFFIASRTRQTVKRPAFGAEGFVIDHYDRAAIDNHLKSVGDKLFEVLGKTPPYAIFSDSLEVYNSDWTGDLLDKFRKRRGYDLMPYLPALAIDIGDKTAAIRHDWGKTLTELCEERYLKPVHDWAQRHGTLLRSQTYGIPPVTLSSSALVDLPEGEGWHWRQFSTTRWAASASHLFGKPMTSSETWTWLNSPVFRATPLDMKAEADLHFLEGVTQLIGHGWPYSPPYAGEPGWRFYAAAVFNQHNPWWIVMPDIAAYLQRITFLMRQGRPAIDVALYLPTADAYAGFTVSRNASVNQAIDGLIGPNVIPQILDAGYNFDFIDDGAIAKAGVPYRVLVLPNVERIPLATLRRIDEYARKGGIVVATRRLPSLAPGLLEAEPETPKIRELASRIRLVNDDTKVGAELRALTPPDLVSAPEIGFVHRKLDYADIYFVANTSNQPVRADAQFRISGLAAAQWDPFSGKVAGAAGGPRIALALAPYESRVLVFSKDRVPPPTAPTGAAPEPIDITRDWTLTFPGTGLPAHIDTLRSWTEEENRKYFSGSATYEKSFPVPQTMLTAGRRIYLNFGAGVPVAIQQQKAGNGMRAMLESPVREAAVVYVNGKRAGSVWSPPYEVEVTPLLHAGENSLRVVVANLALNEMAKGPLPDYTQLNARYGERFQAQDMAGVQALPSGLMGPVRLIVR